LENPIITGVAHDRSEGKITVTGVPDTPGMAARIFRVVADAEINIDMVLQNISNQSDGKTDITFTLPRSDGPNAVAALEKAKEQIGYAELIYDNEVGKVSLVGAGMRNHPGVTATFCEALSDAGINIETMNTSEIRISVICRSDQLDGAVRALHAAFELDSEEEAVVAAGTGR
jgi:aspartate kinase